MQTLFWVMMFAVFGIVSVVVLNPLPIIFYAVVWAISKPTVDSLNEEAMALGVNPNMPAVPKNSTDFGTCLIWIVLLVLTAMLLFAIMGLAIEGKL